MDIIEQQHTVHVSEIAQSIQDTNIIWILVPIFFIGVITDKYQEELGTSIGNAISNGALVIFTSFSWLQHISTRDPLPLDITLSQYFLTFLAILYGFLIIASGFRKVYFATKYGRIRVITYILMFVTLIIHVPILYNPISVLSLILILPFYYAFITELIKVFPNPNEKREIHIYDPHIEEKAKIEKFKRKIHEYLG